MAQSDLTLTFRNGSIFFDATAGAGSLSGAAVPEPSTVVLLITGLGLVLAMRRRGRAGSQRLPLDATEMHSVSDKRGARSMMRRSGFCTAAFCLVGSLLARGNRPAATGGIPLTNGDFELPGPVGTKTVAFDNTGAVIPGIIPGWTFTGGSGNAATGEVSSIAGEPNVGFGHALSSTIDTAPGDSGDEGGGHPGNELLLSSFDGKVYQTSATNITNIPSTQAYRLSFDAHDIFTPGYGSPLTSPSQLTARIYYGASRTTLLSQTINLTGNATNYVMTIPGGSASLAAAVGQPIGVEFDDTAYENSVALNTSSGGTNPILQNSDTMAQHGSWGGADNVLLQIAPTTPGDLNGDGTLNTADYDVLRAHMQTASPYIADGELTGDGVVNLNDFRAFRTLLRYRLGLWFACRGRLRS